MASRTAANASGRTSSRAASICSRSRLRCSLRSSLWRAGSSPASSVSSSSPGGTSRSSMGMSSSPSSSSSRARSVAVTPRSSASDMASYSGSISLMAATSGSSRRTSRSLESTSRDRNFFMGDSSIRRL